MAAEKKAKKNKSKNDSLRKPVVLIILDGWGVGPNEKHGNAIVEAKTPVFDSLMKRFPSTTLKCWGKYVGLPKGQEGNSEAGHLNIGAGRVVRQEILDINECIDDGTFFKNAAFLQAIKHIKKNNKRLHLMGMLSNGDSGHASPKHLYALLDLARKEKIEKVFLHLFTDGRDSPRFAAPELLAKLEKHFDGREHIATVMGRFYAMDRNKLWGRTKLAYQAIACGQGLIADDARSAILHAYNRGESDEFIMPTLIKNGDGSLVAQIEDDDGVIFYNLRSDRARQITKAFVQPDFEKVNKGAFERPCRPKNMQFVAMTDFGPDLPNILTAFPSRDIKNGLVDVIGDNGYRQLHVAESEKFAHITYFLNGGYPEPVSGEDRIKLSSPDVSRYDKVPEMSSYKITDRAISAIRGNEYDFVAINYAAPDMIGHTGNFAASVKTAEVIDECLAKLVSLIMEKDGIAIITADHGNIDNMLNAETGEVVTEHSLNPVPFIIVDEKNRHLKLKKNGKLANIAPTVLKLLDLPVPDEMIKPLF